MDPRGGSGFQEGGRPRQRSASRLAFHAVNTLIAAGLVATTIVHCMLVPEHMHEGIQYGTFFIVSSVQLAGLTLSVLYYRNHEAIYWAIAWALLILIGLYFLVRTWTVPGLMLEDFDALGLETKAVEAGVAGFCVLQVISLRRTAGAHARVSGRSPAGPL